MTPQELKNSILQLAIQGKLVEQRPQEGTAEELFAQIQAEKQQLVKAGKIKKEKPLPPITEDEKPFDIPESWRWVRVQEIVSLNPKNNLSDELEVSFIPMALVEDGYHNKHSFEIRKWGDIKKGFTHFAEGDIGIAKITPCFQNRKSVVFRNLKNGYGAGTTELSVVRCLGDLLSRDFLLWFFKSAYFIENGVKSFTGTAGQQRIHKDYLTMCVFPLPPLGEQKRIVAKIEELMPLVDRYEQAWSKLEQLNSRFPEDMKKSLLQYAIQGKLVEQHPEEGTAEELFAQIQEEKQQLVKAGKIKKEKPLPPISEDEKPFDIPESWRWVRLSEIWAVLNGDRGKNYPSKSTLAKTGIPFISAINLDGKTVVADENLLCLSQVQYEKLGNGKLQKNDIVVCIRGSLGKHGVYPFEKGAIASSLVILRNYSASIYSDKFLLKYLDSPLFFSEIRKYDNGTAQPNLAAKSLEQFLFPLPPLGEQKRIVAKIEELLPLCEQLQRGEIDEKKD